MLSDGALLIQRLEGSRPHGGLCTLNESDRVQKVKTFAVMGIICGFDGRVERRSWVLKHQGVAGKTGGRAVLARCNKGSACAPQHGQRPRIAY
jgi:hypothetical protein